MIIKHNYEFFSTNIIMYYNPLIVTFKIIYILGNKIKERG